MRRVLAEHLLQQRRVREDVEHEVYPGDALVGEMVADQLLQEVSALVDVLDEERFVEGEVHLEEADHGLHDRVKFVAELKRGRMILLKYVDMSGIYLSSSFSNFSFSSSLILFHLLHTHAVPPLSFISSQSCYICYF